ncbi:MAG: signal peptidase I [Bacilli bacterium]|nr:signal peptidase I [Bacilli bacterium]MDD4282440.1 signal peptidase I [Bacilli bacterium]MDD4718911.1 signal peptidase I [Bacilli bacterium]
MKILKEISTYVIVVLIVILIRTFIITPVRVNGNSMKPTLNNNEILLLTKIKNNIKRFDIIVIEVEGERLVKRVIGLPGEHIKYVNNQLYVNDNLTNELFLETDTTSFDIKSMEYEIIPDNTYFVMGDNRGYSKDSRSFGPVNIDNIVGKTTFRLYPLTKIGKVK